LREIGQAVFKYETAYRHFPPAAGTDKDGKPLLSWRVHLLPYLGRHDLYREFHLDEPWDSPHNRKLIDRMPAVFRSPAQKKGEAGTTTYLAPVGEATAFPGVKALRVADFTDGLSNTILLVDADDDHAVVWTRAEDLKYDPQKPLRGLGGHHPGGFLALFADGTVQFLPENIHPTTLHALFTRNGGETIPGDLTQPVK
jgi:hypothetical protein